METVSESNPTAVFMAFGTQGDVYPIAAIAAAFACDQKQYRVFLITHSAHENLTAHLVKKNVAYLPVTSPPVLSPPEDHGSAGSPELSFSLKKRHVSKEHRRECLSIIENIFQHGACTESDFIAINFFALEGWSLAELFHVRCIVTAPYVVPYSAPSSFERCFKKELPSLYEYLQEAPADKVSWKDIVHWMWPLFTQDWGLWRSAELNLSACPFMDPVTGVPAWHDRYPSPLLLYGFSTEIVECPDYWPPNVRVCGFWFLPIQWQFSCDRCREVSALKPSAERSYTKNNICLRHTKLQSLLSSSLPTAPIFIGLSSVGRMGFLRNPLLFVRVLQSVLDTTSYNFILFTAGYEPLNMVVQVVAAEESFSSERSQCGEDEISIFRGRIVCFSGTMPYHWLFPRCAAAIHHGGSGSTAAALHAGIPQVICPFMLDQFYWAERMSWLGVAPEPLKRSHLLPETNDNLAIREAVNALSKAINYALTPEVKARALEISKTISLEDGIFEAVKILKEEVCRPKSVDL